MENVVEVKFGADASGLESGAEQSAQAVEGIEASVHGLSASIKELSAQIAAAFSPAAPKAMADGVKNLQAETEKEVTTLRTMALTIHEGVESFNKFKMTLAGIAEVYMTAFAVERIVDWAKEMGEASEKVEHMGMALGMTATEILSMQTIANATGMSLESAQSAVMRLERALGMANMGSKQASGAFQKLGIDITQARTPAELFNTVVAKFAALPPSLDKSQEAMALFGRNIGQVAPLLGLTTEALAEITAQQEKYDTTNSQAHASALALAESFNENKNAMQGMGNVMAQAFAPVMTVLVQQVNELSAAFIKSYNSGGVAKSIMDALVFVFKALVDGVVFLGSAFVFVWDTIDGAAWMGAGVIQAVVDAILGYVKYLIDAWKTLGDIIRDALTLNWGAIKADFSSGMKRIADDVVAAAHKAGQDAAKGFSEGLKSWKNGDAVMAWDDAFTAKLWGAKGAAPKPDTPSAKTKGDGLGAGPPPKSRMSEWEAELNDELAANGQFFESAKAQELAYWQGKLTMTKAGSEENLAVRKKIFELERALAQAELQAKVEAVQAGEKVDEEGAKAALEALRGAYALRIDAIRDAEKAGAISKAAAHAETIALLKQEVADEEHAADAIFAIQRSALLKEADLLEQRPAERQKVLDKLKELEAKHAADVQAIQIKSARDVQKEQAQALSDAQRQAHSYVDPLVNAWSQGIEGMVKGTMTLRQAWQNVGASILSTIMGVVERTVGRWIVGEFTKTSATAAGAATRVGIEATAATTTTGISAASALVQIAHKAAVAAAAAYSAIAGIPIVGPILAPIAAATALAGVFALGKMIFSAEGGMDRVPYDGAMFQLHKDEMVLPASIATPARAFFQGGGSGADGSRPSAANGDTYHVTIQAMDGLSFRRFLEANPDALANALGRQVRNLRTA